MDIDDMIPLPLQIVCPNAINQPYHPSVIYREDGFGGHRYWMAQTPYPTLDILPYRDRYELPCIYYSDDGIKWIPINNPLDDLTIKEIADRCYFSDPHLVEHNGCLEIFYRFSDRNGIVTIYKRTSIDGLKWSDRIIIADLHDRTACQIWGKTIISPSLLWRDNKGYECWYVDDTYKNISRQVRYITSKDGFHWSNSKVCVMYGDIKPWHIDVQRIDGELNMLVYDVDDEKLDWYVGGPTQWHFSRHLLKPSGKRGDFYETGLYRACLLKVKDIYRVYFSAHNKECSAIGLLKIDSNNRVVICSGQSFLKTLRYNLYIYYKQLRRKLKSILLLWK